MPSSKRSQRNTGPWSSSRILNASSPIVKSDIHAFLLKAMSAWEESEKPYTEAEKRSIIESLPPAWRNTEHNNSESLMKGPLSVDMILNDPHFRLAIQKFKEDVTEGHYETTWRKQAIVAMHDRREGKFEGYLRSRTNKIFDASAETSPATGSVDVEMYSSDGEWSDKKAAKDKDGARHRDKSARLRAHRPKQ